MKLQESYFSESNAIGKWELIGYKGPGSAATGSTSAAPKTQTTSFKYEQDGTYSNDGGTIAMSNGSLSETTVWKASNLIKLNECDANKEWAVKATVSSSVVSFSAKVPSGDAGCKTLTPSFENIGR
ncbi:MAG: hypothetical protein HUK21_10630 [Fibrobacteraceae bacterium]|nr:hypothetical protein [Fibrobacteraceae bacterium]